jgi:dipeptidyl aminopeptidase/acylaminoacyl peptidase
MRKLGPIALAVATLWACVVNAAPLDIYGKLPNLSDVNISPDGARLAFVLTDGERHTIVIRDMATGKPIKALDAGVDKLRYLMWAGPDHLILVDSKTALVPGLVGPRREYLMAYDYSLKIQKMRPLLRDGDYTMNTIYGAPLVRTIAGKPTLFLQGVKFVDNHGVLSLFQIDLENDTSRLAEEGQLNTQQWVVDGDGNAIAQALWNPKSGRWSLKIKVKGYWQENKSQQALSEPPYLSGLGRDGHSALVEELHDGVVSTREVSADGVWSEPLKMPEGKAMVFDPLRHNLIGYETLVGDERSYTFLDPQDAKVWQAVQKAYPKDIVQLASWSEDRKHIVIAVDSAELGPGYALVNLESHHADWLGDRYEGLKAEDVAPVRPIRFKAQDGTQLSGYLTTPHGKDAKNLPLVVFPHGGPAARDTPGFDWWAQAMASRGYAVLQVNFRGSDGFGWNFLQAGFGEWGRKMQTDLSDGVRYMAAQGAIDPKRVCIVGASYGGYAAMAGPTLDPGVYRCAVAYAGISDMRNFTPWERDQGGDGSERYLLRFLGGEGARDPSLLAISPASHVDKVTVPMLLIHGKDDTVVPMRQSVIMANALKAAGKPVELIQLDSTDHWLSRGDTRLAMLQATMAFLEKNNPPN